MTSDSRPEFTYSTRRDPTGLGPVRSAPFTVTRSDDDEHGDGFTMEGYAAVFGHDTEIDSWEGRFIERLRPGLFRNTLRGGRKPMLQYDHGQHPFIGSIPIGVIRDLYEDENGLFVRARFTDSFMVRPIRDAIADGALTGMSFRFVPIRDEWRDNTGKIIRDRGELERLLYDAGDRGPLTRDLVEVKLLELGPVAWPAYDATSVGVRSAEARSVLHALRNPAVRDEVARALLVDPPTDDEPVSSGQPPDEGAVDGDTSEDTPQDPDPGDETAAPPAETGPPADGTTSTDAPPAETGPPSAPPETPGDGRSSEPTPADEILRMLGEVRASRRL